MIKADMSVVISKPVEQVFAYLSDSRNEPQWSAGVVQVSVSPDGPLRLGSKITEVRNFMNRKIESLSEIVEYEPNKKFVRKGGSTQTSIDGTFSFEPAAQGTQVTWTMQMESGGFFKVAEPLVAAIFKKELTSNLKTVKRLLESQMQ